MKAPKVSVLVPTYNYARFLPEALESVLAQNFRDFELLIADDASTDNSAEIAESFTARDVRIKFTRHPANIGMVNNWNFCLRQAQGEYVKFLFGDDRLCGPNALGKYVHLLDSHPSATLAASARVVFDENSRILDLYRDLPSGSHDGRKIIESILRAGGKNQVGEPSAVLFRKKDLPNGFHSRFRQVVDVQTWFQLLEKGALAYTDEPLCGFRIHGLQATERNTASGVAFKEYTEFFSEYAARPEISRTAACAILFRLRQWRSAGPHVRAGEEILIRRLGASWFLPYAFYCLRYRLAKPFRNFGHSLQKRRFRRLYPVMTNSPFSF